MASVEHAVTELRRAGLNSYEVYSPVLHHEGMEEIMPRKGSRVRVASALGGITGVLLGLTMCVLSSMLYNLWTGGKPPVSIVPFVVICFECTILFACLATVAALVYFARLRPLAPPADYSPRFGDDRYGVSVECAPENKESAVKLLRAAGAAEVTERHAGAGPTDEEAARG